MASGRASKQVQVLPQAATPTVGSHVTHQLCAPAWENEHEENTLLEGRRWDKDVEGLSDTQRVITPVTGVRGTWKALQTLTFVFL